MYTEKFLMFDWISGKSPSVSVSAKWSGLLFPDPYKRGTVWFNASKTFETYARSCAMAELRLEMRSVSLHNCVRVSLADSAECLTFRQCFWWEASSHELMKSGEITLFRYSSLISNAMPEERHTLNSVSTLRKIETRRSFFSTGCFTSKLRNRCNPRRLLSKSLYLKTDSFHLKQIVRL